MIAAVDADKVRELRRMKLVALSFLIVAAAIYLVARANEDGGPAWVGYVRAGSEAAMVGGLADWFAVTALFRHPLGIPIPHTAIIPRRKDQIGRSLGEFVEGNFLTRDVLVERLEGVDIGQRLGGWLADPVHAQRATAAIGDALAGIVEVLDDRHVQEALGGTVERRLRSANVAPLVARAIDASLDGGHVQRLLDASLSGARTFLAEQEPTLRQRLKHESPWWVPEPLDDRVFNKIFSGLQRFVQEMQDQPDHEVRRAIEERLRVLADRLRNDPLMIAKAEALKDELISHPEVQAWIGSLWGELKRAVLHATSDPQSDLRQRLDAGLVSLGERLVADAQLRRKVDDWVERAVVYVVEQYKSEVADLIASTVERWDAHDTSRRIELQVGHDLQFIRINGTVVGALVGLAIHTVGETLL
ncbi:MAG: DUF445 domain-containing protein [Ilumatobacteraceae bacterium]